MTYITIALEFLDRYHDAINVVVAVVIAVLTFVLARVGWRQAKIIDAQQRLQRAYVFGGCGETGLSESAPNGLPVFCFQPGYRNYGQTPAWVDRMVLVYCPEPLPRRPNYDAGETREISDSVGPGGHLCLAPGGPEMREMATPTLMLYGRIYYLDMLENERFSSFVYRLRNDGRHERIAGERFREFRRWE
jgi:hypothetical protein